MKRLILILCLSCATVYIYGQEKSFTLDELQHANKSKVLKDVGKIAVDTAKQSKRKIGRKGKSGKELNRKVVSTADTLNKLKTRADKLKGLNPKDLEKLD